MFRLFSLACIASIAVSHIGIVNTQNARTIVVSHVAAHLSCLPCQKCEDVPKPVVPQCAQGDKCCCFKRDHPQYANQGCAQFAVASADDNGAHASADSADTEEDDEQDDEEDQAETDSDELDDIREMRKVYAEWNAKEEAKEAYAKRHALTQAQKQKCTQIDQELKDLHAKYALLQRKAESIQSSVHQIDVSMQFDLSRFL